MGRMRVVAVVLAALAALTVSTAYAAWPTTCMELNDLAEAAAGNHHNVGIYQRVFGSQAEAACRHDHWDDVRGTFSWALQGTKPPPPQPPARPQSPPATQQRIDPSLQPAWNIFSQTETGSGLLEADNAKTVRVQWGTFQSGSHSAYNRSTHTITISETLRNERLPALVTLLVHEVFHAVSFIPYPRDRQACVDDEVWAFALSMVAWLNIGPATPITAP